MDDLIAFLNERQNDKARDAILHAVEVLLWPHEDRDSVRSPGWYVAQCDICDWHTSGGEPVVEDSCREHIVEKHPPRELAEVDATRKIIALYNLDFNDDGQPIYLGGYGEAYWDVLRLLALPYADRPDYRAEWRPEP